MRACLHVLVCVYVCVCVCVCVCVHSINSINWAYHYWFAEDLSCHVSPDWAHITPPVLVKTCLQWRWNNRINIYIVFFDIVPVNVLGIPAGLSKKSHRLHNTYRKSIIKWITVSSARKPLKQFEGSFSVDESWKLDGFSIWCLLIKFDMQKTGSKTHHVCPLNSNTCV